MLLPSFKQGNLAGAGECSVGPGGAEGLMASSLKAKSQQEFLESATHSLSPVNGGHWLFGYPIPVPRLTFPEPTFSTRDDALENTQGA